MTAPDARLAQEIDEALNAFLNAKPDEKSKARAEVHRVLWDNKAGIVAGLRASQPGTVSRDWTEDASHENGNYECKCCECGNSFTGHKRRVLCKACSRSLSIPANGRALAELPEYLDCLESDLIGLDVDFKLKDIIPPGVWADRVRATLSALPVKEEALDSKGATSAAESICDWADNNLSMYEACTEENPVKAREIFEAAKRLRDLLKNIPAVSADDGTKP